MCSFCTRLIDSMPPPIAISTPSSITERAATAIACRPEAHWRSIVVPATVTGKPGADRALARDVHHHGALLHRAAHHHVLDLAGRDAGALHRLGHHMAGQRRAVGVVERAAIGLADAGARGGNDHCFSGDMLASLALGGRVELRVAQHVVGGIAELDVDGGNPLEVMADIELVGHAHAAVQLHGLIGDELAGIADLGLGARTPAARAPASSSLKAERRDAASATAPPDAR